MNCVQSAREIYDAFARGDLPAILERLSETVDWEYPPTSTAVPWLAHRRGRDAVAGFFQALESIRLERFAPKEFLAGDRVVVVLIDVDFVVKATGARVTEEDEIHVWRFDERGLVSRFKHGVDSHCHHLALAGGQA